jgi:hypothetical protein
VVCSRETFKQREGVMKYQLVFEDIGRMEKTVFEQDISESPYDFYPGEISARPWHVKFEGNTVLRWNKGTEIELIVKDIDEFFLVVSRKKKLESL